MYERDFGWSHSLGIAGAAASFFSSGLGMIRTFTRTLAPFAIATLALASPACGSDGSASGDAIPSDSDAGDGAPPPNALPGPSACAIPSDAPFVAFSPGVRQIGAFRVDLIDDVRFGVSHEGDPARSLFASAGNGVLSAIHHGLEAKEHQGSFEITENDKITCSRARIDSLTESAGALRLGGSFTAGGGACESLRFSLELCETSPGHLSFHAKTSDPLFGAIDLFVGSEPDERIVGLGEQFRHDSLDLKGARVFALAQEGGIGRGREPITSAVNAASRGSGGNENTTYYAAAHYLTNHGRSLFLENDELSVFDFSEPTSSRIRVYAPEMRGQILFAQTPKEHIERFTEYAGRMPPLPAWVDNGAIVALAKTPAGSGPIVDALEQAGVELAAIWNQTWPGKATTVVGEQVLWNWAYNPAANPGWAAYVSGLEQKGVRVLCYVNPMFREVTPELGPVARDIFQEGLAQDAYVKDASGQPHKFPLTAFDVTLLDLTSPGARAWMKSVIKSEMIDKAHCSGWMADFAEALPFDAVLASGQSAAAFHNTYAVEWAKLQREVAEENGLLGDLLVFNRAGYTRTPGASLLVWEGDQMTTWDKHDGLVSALHGMLNAGLSGASLVHSDTGGYTSLSAGGVGFTREDELLKRWAEMNAFTAVLRTHEGNQPGSNAQAYDAGENIQHFARMSKIYKALAFYRRKLFDEASKTGIPVVRHLLLEFPSDSESWTIDDEFMLGSEILVAPIKNKCFTKPICPYNKEVYLPPGEWVHLFSGTAYGQAQSSSRVTVEAPIGEPAVFYKKGSLTGLELVSKLQAAGVL